MDLERVNLLLTTFHAALNVPNTANIQREIQEELTAINEELVRDPNTRISDEPLASLDGSGGIQGVPEESLSQVRRV